MLLTTMVQYNPCGPRGGERGPREGWRGGAHADVLRSRTILSRKTCPARRVHEQADPLTSRASLRFVHEAPFTSTIVSLLSSPLDGSSLLGDVLLL